MTASRWREAARVYLSPRAAAMLCLGFSAGLPYLLVFSTLSAWLTEAGHSRTLIGLLSWVGLCYSLKVLWAPWVDACGIPLLSRLLGRRRAWMLVAQAAIILGLAGMAATDARHDLFTLGALALWVAFASATQDIVIDAWRIEAAPPDRQAAMAAAYITGYRLALLAAGAGALYVAEYYSWTAAYLAMALAMTVGVATTLLTSEPDSAAPGGASSSATSAAPDNAPNAALNTAPGVASDVASGARPRRARLAAAVVQPFADFFQRNGYLALAILAFVGVYRLSDVTLGVMANPFYLDTGYSKKDIADIGKVFGLIMTLSGAALGGVLVARFGIARVLVAGAILSALSNVLFLLPVRYGPDLALLALVIGGDNLSAGLATTAFIAYLSALTRRAYTATQYALFSSLMTLPAKFVAGFSGWFVDAAGYAPFFIATALIGIPVVLFSAYLARRLEPAGGAGKR